MKLKHLFENEVPNITNPYNAYYYTTKQGKRIPELEPLIMNRLWTSVVYAENIIKGRWPEAEPFITKHIGWWNEYLKEFPEVRTPSKNIPVLLSNYVLMDVPNTATDEQVLRIVQLICDDQSISLNDVKEDRIYNEQIIKQELERNKKLKKINIRELKGQSKIGFINKFVIHEPSDFR